MSRRPPAITWSQALAWRMRQQLLDPVGTESVEGVVRRLGAIQAQLDSAAELTVRTRRKQSRSGEVARALAEGRIIKTFAFRGATHLMTPEDGGVYLALRAASRMWELPSWQSYYSLTPSDWPLLREVVREALADGPLTLEELGAAITARPKFRHLTFVFDGNPWTLLKALAWQGDLSFGPAQGRTTFQRLDGNPRWAGVPELEEAGPRAVETYFRAYGPATPDHVQYWLGEGLGAGRKRIQAWVAGFGDRLAAVDIDGEPAYVLREDLEELAATPPTTAVRLLPGYDQWVLGPGTADAHVVPPGRRALVSRQANLVIVGGVVSGTWSLADDELSVNWFAEGRAARAGRARRRGCAARHDPGSAPSVVRRDRVRCGAHSAAGLYGQTMSDDRPYIEANTRQRERLRTLIDALDDEALAAPVNEYWTVAGVLGHIAYWDIRFQTLAEKIDRGEPWASGDAEPDGDWLNDSTRPLIHAIAPRVAAEFALRTAEETDALAARLPLDRLWPGDPDSPISPARGEHRGEHLDEIEAALRAR